MKKDSWLKRNWWIIGFLVGIAISIAAYIYAQGVKDTKAETVHFSNSDLKKDTEEYINTLPTPEEREEAIKLEQKKFMLDSFTEVKKDISRANRDTAISKQAVQNYHILEAIEKINNKLGIRN